MENRNILKEEIDIKDEVYIDLTIDTTEPNIISSHSIPESNPFSNVSHLNTIEQESPSKQVSDKTSNDNNVCIGIDNSLKLNPVKGTFSLEKIGSKTLVVFKRLPGDQESKAVNEEASEYPYPNPCPKCQSVFSSHVLLSNHINEAHSLDDVKKKILEGRYIKICSKCNTPTESNSVVNCVSCTAEFHYKCRQCNQTFTNYEKLSHHLLMQCTPHGFYHCPQCDYRATHFNFVHRHFLKEHPDLESTFDIHSIVWKNVIVRDGNNGSERLKLTCSSCNKTFSSLRNLNYHASRCLRLHTFRFRPIGLDTDAEFQIDANVRSKTNGRKIVLHCNKCSKDTDFYHIICRQSSCIECKSLLLFRCTLCDKLMIDNYNVKEHLKSICSPQQKQYSCRFCAITFYSSQILAKHEEQHDKTTNSQNLSKHEEQHDKTKNQLLVLRSEQNSPCPDFEQNDVSSDKSIDASDMRKKLLSNSIREKKSSIFFASQKYDEMFAEKCDTTRQSKHCDKKLQMQCEVLLTPLRIYKSRRMMSDEYARNQY